MPPEPALAPSRSVDTAVERVGRRLAARTTRRSFLGRAGRAAVLLAGGPALVPLLADPAAARVCGQSGTAPKCATFDCDATWGWCWYASGCCADGALKKICDCCAPNTPHPRGYCPSGTRVKCIVESCGADPRLQTVELRRIADNDPVFVSVAASRRRASRAGVAVLGDAGRPRDASVAMSTGRTAGGPVLLTGPDGVDQRVADELDRLGVEAVVVVGARLQEVVAGELAGAGLRVEALGTTDSTSTTAAEVAAWQRRLTGSRRAVVLLGGLDAAVAGPAAAFAHARRLPLLHGDTAATREALTTPRPVTTTYVIAAESEAASGFPGAQPIVGSGAGALAARLGEAALDAGVPRDRVALAPLDHPATAVATAALAAPVLLNHADRLASDAFAWLETHRSELAEVTAVGDRGSFSTDAQWELQGLVNEFEVHRLTGSAGEGLPVIPQPPSERPIGQARW